MLGSYKFSREEIVNKIKSSCKTKDGYYICKKFPLYNKQLGNNIEKKYMHSRENFENQICFSKYDIEMYLEKEKFNPYICMMIRRDNYLNDILKNDIKFPLKKKLPQQNFTLSELIDTAIYFFNNKYI